MKQKFKQKDENIVNHFKHNSNICIYEYVRMYHWACAYKFIYVHTYLEIKIRRI